MQFMLLSLLSVFATKKKASLGIDLGTTYTCVYVTYVQDDGNPTIELVKFDGLETIPSVIKNELVENEYVVLAGRKARNSYEKDYNPLRYYYQAKRILGRGSLRDDVELMNFNSKVSYTVKETQHGNNLSSLKMCYLDENENVIDETTPLKVSGKILEFIRLEIEKDYIIEQVVITVPVNFLENQKSATLGAAKIGGFKDAILIFEPVAAAYSYESKRPSSKGDSIYVVYDHGGGTLDCGIFDYSDTVLITPHSSGKLFNGGEDFTKSVTDYFLKVLAEKKCVLVENSRDYSKLKKAAEDLKIKLCNLQNDLDNSGVVENAKVSTIFSTATSTFELELDTDTFNKVIEPKLKEIIDMFEGDVLTANEKKLSVPELISKRTVAQAFKNAHPQSFFGYMKENLKWGLKDVDRVLCVGGSSRVPIVRNILRFYFGNEKIITDVDADKIVAEGAAYYAAKTAGYLKGDDRITLITSVSVPLGICVNENTFFPLIKVGDTLPAKASEVFTTSQDNQPAVMIRVAQGLRPAFNDNHFLGQFELKIENKAPKGVPKIKIFAEWDMTGDLHVSAMDEATQLENKIFFNRSDAALTPELIEKLTRDAKENQQRDAELMATYAEKQKLEAYIESVKQRMLGPEIDQQSRIKIEKEINVVTSWLEREKSAADKNDFINKTEELKKVLEPLFEKKDEKVREEL